MISQVRQIGASRPCLKRSRSSGLAVSADTDHLRCLEPGERAQHRRPLRRRDRVRIERGVDRRVLADVLHDRGQLRGLEERQPAVAVVIGSAPKRSGRSARSGCSGSGGRRRTSRGAASRHRTCRRSRPLRRADPRRRASSSRHRRPARPARLGLGLGLRFGVRLGHGVFLPSVGERRNLAHKPVSRANGSGAPGRSGELRRRALVYERRLELRRPAPASRPPSVSHRSSRGVDRAARVLVDRAAARPDRGCATSCGAHSDGGRSHSGGPARAATAPPPRRARTHSRWATRPAASPRRPAGTRSAAVGRPDHRARAGEQHPRRLQLRAGPARRAPAAARAHATSATRLAEIARSASTAAVDSSAQNSGTTRASQRSSSRSGR